MTRAEEIKKALKDTPDTPKGYTFHQDFQFKLLLIILFKAEELVLVQQLARVRMQKEMMMKRPNYGELYLLQSYRKNRM